MNSLFQKELEQLINKYSMENESNTPDFILAEYLAVCLSTFAHAISKREKWYGKPYINPAYINADGIHKIGISPDDFKALSVGPPPTDQL